MHNGTVVASLILVLATMPAIAGCAAPGAADRTSAVQVAAGGTPPPAAAPKRVAPSADATPPPAASSAAPSPGDAKPPDTVPGKGPIEVVSAQFGVFGADSNGRRFLYETDHFPAVVAAPFGWFVIFKTDKPTVVWREEFELPQEPPTWGPGEAIGAYTISPDRRTAVTERIIPARMGFVANEWRYAPGDPVGNHKMRVYIDGQLIREFAFAIEPSASSDAHRTPGPNPHRSSSPSSI